MDQRRGGLLGVLASVVVLGCGNSPPGQTYFARNIQPILLNKCSGSTSGCHAAQAEDPYAFAAGNLDVTTFDNIQKRRDVLAPFGPYPYPLLLIKAVAPSTPDPTNPNKLQFQYGVDTTCTTDMVTPCTMDSQCGTGTCGNPLFKDIDVLHAGGSIIQVSSDAYFTLQTWIENGATENGLKPPTPAQTGNGVCSTVVPATFDPTALMMNPNYAAGLTKFTSDVQPILTQHGCVSGNCHGAPQSDFYITCGSDANQIAFNYSQAWSFVNSPVDDSQILRIPLAVAAGGRGHTGGDQFASTTDPDYVTIHDWAQMVGKIQFATPGTPKQFFQDNVQPLLVSRGCSFEACHSPEAFNDFKLRSGTQGFYSAISLQKNYDLLKDNFLALEFPDARRGRAVAKPILANDYRITGIGGIAHRGGSVLETPGTTATPGVPSDPTACGAWSATSSAFCTVQHWIDLERAAIATEITPMDAGSPINIVYVDRPAGQTAGRLEFDTFQPGAILKVAAATFGADFGQQISVTGTQDLLTDASCAGATGGDLAAPDVANDGDSVAFAARPSAAMGWSVWTVSIASGACKQVVASTGTIHNFDPAWSPDSTYLVFASTRGKSGPTLSRKRFLPQSDLWRIKLADGTLQQLTFLSNSEISPQFMREGRMTMTTEKVSDGFYQLAGRRLNWDLTDYHPLLGQRDISPYASLTDLTQTKPSIAYGSTTDVREGNDGNFMLILSDLNADGTPALPAGAGALATFNRSIGPFESGRYDPGFLASVQMINANVSTGHAGAVSGYRAPFYMPDGQIMVSFAPSLTSLAWEIDLVSPRTGDATALIQPAGGRAVVDAVLAYKYPARGTFENRRQLVFGGSSDPNGDQSHAVVHMPSAPVVFTLLTGNLRRGRPVDAFSVAKYLVVYSEGMCPPGACSANTNGIYEMRTVLGKAPLAADGSVKVQLPSETGLVFELQDGNGNSVVKMTEEHQLGPSEQINMGVQEPLYNVVCAGCHGSITGRELDIGVNADALTSASASTAATTNPVPIGP